MTDESTPCGSDPRRVTLFDRDTASLGADGMDASSASLVVGEGLLEGPPPPRSGETVGGKYVLHELAGQGGMGTVWRAEQITPLKRPVAIKFLRDGLQRHHAVPRFAIEQQVLARMSHPNIASVFDSGVSDHDEPYLVMEYVDGAPLHTFCDRKCLSIAERLQLVVGVCLAVEHAHQRGIIHRDLKPSNILVTNSGGAPLPKVIDFGLAKALPWSACGGDSPGRTLPGDVVGTPLYMAPEQIVSPDDGIDTRSDVYAIGVILYEIATGDVPFPLFSHEDGGWVRTLHAIVHEDPQRPTRKVQASKNEPLVAASRGLAPGQLARAIRGDLEWIILKAIAKRPTDRYSSVAALRKDILRLLGKHPVHARRATLAYRANRFYCRHPLLVCLTVLLGLALVSGLAGTTWALLRTRAAQAEARIALANERKANDRIRRAIATLAASVADDSREGLSAAAAYRQIVALHDIASDHDTALDHIGDTRGAETPDSAGAVQLYRHVLDLLAHVHREQPLANYRFLEVNVRSRMAQELVAAGLPESAIEEYRRCEAVMRELEMEDPENARYRQRLAALQASSREASRTARSPPAFTSPGAVP